jgi:hypothetical protein
MAQIAKATVAHNMANSFTCYRFHSGLHQLPLTPCLRDLLGLSAHLHSCSDRMKTLYYFNKRDSVLLDKESLDKLRREEAVNFEGVIPVPCEMSGYNPFQRATI